MQGFYESFESLTDALDDKEFSELKDESELEFASGVLRVLHTPGHTPGSCSLFREANRTLICGDCVLKRITPNPVLSPDPFDSNKRFKSLARISGQPRAHPLAFADSIFTADTASRLRITRKFSIATCGRLTSGRRALSVF